MQSEAVKLAKIQARINAQDNFASVLKTPAFQITACFLVTEIAQRMGIMGENVGTGLEAALVLGGMFDAIGKSGVIESVSKALPTIGALAPLLAAA